jgi:hypothetical protein
MNLSTLPEHFSGDAFSAVERSINSGGRGFLAILDSPPMRGPVWREIRDLIFSLSRCV